MTNGEKLKEIFPCEIKEQPYRFDERCVFYEGLDFVKLFRTSWWNAEYKEPTTKNDLGVDAVSRQEVLYLIADNDLSMGQVVRGIHALPPVTPQEPRKGHWIKVTNGRGGHECDVCHDYAPSFQSGNEYLSAFCPNCGADMRGEE